MVSNKKIEIFKKSWKLNKSFNISRSSKLSAETVEVKISDRNFGKDRRYPITNFWKNNI